VPLEPQRVLALGRYERPFPGDRVLPVQDALLEEASAATGGQLRPMLLGGMASFRDVWFPLAQTEPSHLASGTLVQEALEGHNNIQAIYFNTTGTELLHAGHTSAEYRSVLVAAAAGTHKVDIFIEHEGGLSVIRAGADHLEGAPLPAELVRHLPPSFDTAAKAAPVAGTGTATAPGITTTPIDLQRKFKHASDFGIVGNYNPTSAKLFDAAVKAHVESPGVQEINGSYRGNPARIFVDPKTRLAVITKPSGEFVSGWRLTPEQLQYVLNKRKLGGS
jgi:hypothetical protein